MFGYESIVGTGSDVTNAMGLGAEGVLLNTGIAGAKDPVAMAAAMRHVMDAGYLAVYVGRDYGGRGRGPVLAGCPEVQPKRTRPQTSRRLIARGGPFDG